MLPSATGVAVIPHYKPRYIQEILRMYGLHVHVDMGYVNFM